MIGKKGTLLIAVVALLCMAGTLWADDAPLLTEEVSAPMLMPFRVWVCPSFNNGRTVAGHYEYFEMPIVQGSRIGLVSPSLNPVYAPVMLPQGNSPSVPH